MTAYRCRALASAFLVLTLTSLVTSAAASDPLLTPDGPSRPLYTWATQRCQDLALPDAPARALRRADGQIVLLASHYENWTMVGPNFGALKPACRTVLSSKAGVSSQAGRLWIEAVHTRDGVEVAALISQDLTRPTRDKGCVPTGQPGSCWLNAILEARSTDGGESFRLGEPVAASPADYPPGSRGRVGVFTTTNIAARSDGYVMLAWAEGGPMQKRGNCLFRSPDPLQPGSWRAWGGAGFTVDMRDAAHLQPCQPVSPSILTSEVRSITWLPRQKRWIAVLASRQKLPGDAVPVPGFYMSTSEDLVTWSRLRRIMPAPTKAREQQMDHVVAYPSLLDPDSTSRNFDTLDGDSPLLLFTLQHLANGRGTLNRDLMAVPLKLSAGD